MPTQYLLGINSSLETKLLSQLGERVDVTLRLMAKVEVVAFMYFAGV